MHVISRRNYLLSVSKMTIQDDKHGKVEHIFISLLLNKFTSDT